MLNKRELFGNFSFRIISFKKLFPAAIIQIILLKYSKNNPCTLRRQSTISRKLTAKISLEKNWIIPYHKKMNMDIDVPLTDKHSQELKDYIKRKKLKQDWLKDVLGISQTKISKLKNDKPVNKGYSYLHVSRLIKKQEDSKDYKDIRSLRNILAEHIVFEIFDKLPEFNANSFPFKCKINLSDMTSISILKYYLAKCYLEDFEDIGLSENIIAPDIDNQPPEYFEGYISASVYLLYFIHSIEYPDLDIINHSTLPWLIYLMCVLNKTQGQVSFDNDNLTEYIKDVFNEQWVINIIKSSKYLQSEIFRFSPVRQSEFFYMGWHSFCVLFLENLITKTDEDLLSYFKKIKYRLLNSVGYCLDKFIEKHDNLTYKMWKWVYYFLILKFKMKGYEEAEKKLIQFDKDNLFFGWKFFFENAPKYNNDFIKDMESVLFCFSNQERGLKVATDLLVSKYHSYMSRSSVFDDWKIFTELMEHLKNYFGTQKITAEQIKDLGVDIFYENPVFMDGDCFQSAKLGLYSYRTDNSKNRQGKQSGKIKTMLNELNYNFNDGCGGRTIADQLVELSKKYEVRIDKLPSRISFLEEFAELYGVYSWNETSRRLFEKYGLELDDILYYMEHYPYRGDVFQENFHDVFFKQHDKLKKTRLANKSPPKSFAEIKKFKNIEEFYDFIQSWEIIDYFSDICIETNAEFLRLFLKVDFSVDYLASRYRWTPYYL